MNYNIMTQIVLAKTYVVRLFRKQFQAKILVTRIKRYANPRREDLGKRRNCETPRRSYIKRRKRKQQSMESNKFLNDTSVQLSWKKQRNNFHVNGAVKDSGNFLGIFSILSRPIAILFVGRISNVPNFPPSKFLRGYRNVNGHEI